jgi:hypothetical protein
MAEQDQWIEAYKRLRSSWVAARGAGGRSTSTGADLPKMIAGDTLALLGPFTDAVIRFHQGRVRRWQPFWATSVGGPVPISLLDYLMKGKPLKEEARKRELTVVVEGFGGARIPTTTYVWPDVTPELAEAQKQLMAAWQATINLGATIIGTGTGSVTRALSPSEVQAYWSKLYQLVICLDVAGDIPVMTDWELAADLAKDVGAKAQVVVEKAAEIAGKAAAEISETVGKAAGAAASGFFSQAGLTAIVVAAGAVYIALS